jgi:hypothetical protein
VGSHRFSPHDLFLYDLFELLVAWPAINGATPRKAQCIRQQSVCCKRARIPAITKNANTTDKIP